MINTAQVALSTTPAELTSFDANRGHVNEEGSNRLALAFLPTVDCYVGGSGVTSANGFKVVANQFVSFDLNPDERLYAVLATGTGTGYRLLSGL